MRTVAGLSLAVIAATGAALSAAAVAQDPAAPSGSYGGGELLAPPNPITQVGNLLVSFRVSGTRVKLNVGMGIRCGSGYFRATATLNPDGTFTASDTFNRRPRKGVRISSRYTVTGVVSGASATGTVRLTNRIYENGRKRLTCGTRRRDWGARRPSGDLGAPGGLPKATLYGTTSQRLEGPRRAIVMRIDKDPRRLKRAIYEVTLDCGSRKITQIVDAPRRHLKIVDGKVHDVERFTYKYAKAIEHVTERFDGTIGMAGASGTFSIVSRIANRASGQTRLTCRSGTVAWTAST